MSMESGNAAAFGDRFRTPADRGNPIRNLDPIVVFVVLVALAIVPIAFPGFIAAAIVCLIYPVVALLAGVAREFLPTYLKLFLAVGLVLFVLRAAFIAGDDPLFRLGNIAPTWAGIAEGARFSLLVMSISGAVTLFFAVVTVRYLMLALELRGVTPRATYIILASFQSITDLGRNARTVLEAQQSRGIETQGNMLVRARAFFPILAPVFLAALNQTEERAIALDARAFNARTRHTHLVTLRRTRPAEIVFAAVVVAAVVAAFIGSALGWF
jgi:energy-coupling factor transport system permease protein